MAITKEICKADVKNSLSMFNTVGQELIEIFAAHNMDDAENKMAVKGLAQKKQLTPKQINKACELLGLGDELRNFLVNFQNEYELDAAKCNAQYKKSKKNFTKLKKIIPLLRNEFNDGVDKLDDILDYFDVDSEDEIFSESEATAVLFRKQNKINVDPVGLKAWLRRGELDFQKMDLPQYDKEGFMQWIESREWESNLENVDYFLSLPQVLSDFGIALVYIPFLPKTVYGAVRWFDNRPLVEVSDRNRDLATCWFTLFHEFGHIIKHEHENIFEGEMNESTSKKSKIETEANKFANHYLFNGDDLRKEIFYNKKNSICMNSYELANRYKVNRLFVSYWLFKAQYLPTFQKKIHIDFISSYQS